MLTSDPRQRPIAPRAARARSWRVGAEERERQARAAGGVEQEQDADGRHLAHEVDVLLKVNPGDDQDERGAQQPDAGLGGERGHQGFTVIVAVMNAWKAQ